MEKKYGIPALVNGCQFWNRKVCMTLDDAKVLIETDLKAEEIARKALKVASDICVFTNNNVTMEKI